ncbi:endopeptidase La [Candidatus Sumerlaeota bacterium]|nr:endopeptidase La [Candidatus Sumerlaeota bacterium]
MTETFIETDEQSLVLPVLPLPDVVIFPNSISPLFVVRPRSIAAVERAMSEQKDLFLVTQKSIEAETPSAADLHDVGTVSQILQVQRLPDGSIRIFVEGKEVSRCVEYSEDEKTLWAQVEPIRFSTRPGKRLTALKRTVLGQFETYAHLSERIPEDLYLNIKNIEEPLALCHAIANYCAFNTADKQALLEMGDVSQKYLFLSRIFSAENDLLGIETKILNQVKNQIGKSQKEYFLSEQLKVIEKELGIGNEEDVEIDEIQKAIDESKMSDEARDKAQRELARYSRMAPMSPESTVSRTYIEWLLDFPWGVYTKDRLELRRASRILNEDHYGLDKVKERIIEYLAVLRMVEGKMRGPILCLVGPPGVGKTSLARSIARTLGRKFARFSLGGVRDEAEIRGHRRTYVGALPGKIVQMMKKAGSSNPVLLLDEVDKMNTDFRGDPASALLEVLDPEQNVNFNDHYMEVDLDLSRVLFITTANTTDGIPWALQDRMEILRLPGYTRDEKMAIAQNFLVPRQLKEHGLHARQQIVFKKEGLEYLIDHYTREAGVRNLEREIASLCRKVARKAAESDKARAANIDPKTTRRLLGPVRFKEMEISAKPEIGSATGLAWTEVGGEILSVETTTMPGKGNLLLTGKLGDVMQESAKAALSYIRGHAKGLGIAEDFHEKTDIHVHLPEGAIPKDGPSGGVAMVTSIVSALSRRPVRQDVAMTGEITLRGKVLKIGGLKEKVIAAHRVRVRIVILPDDNRDDLEEVSADVRRELQFVPVTTIDEVLRLALSDPPSDAAAKPAKDPEPAQERESGKKPPRRSPRRRPAQPHVVAR